MNWTAIERNSEEAIDTSSKKNIIHKLEIAYRQARETRYRSEPLKQGEPLEEKLANSFIKR